MEANDEFGDSKKEELEAAVSRTGPLVVSALVLSSITCFLLLREREEERRDLANWTAKHTAKIIDVDGSTNFGKVEKFVV